MPRRPRTLPTRSNDNRILRKQRYAQEYDPESDVPHILVRALIRALYQYFTQPARRRDLEQFQYEVLEEGLLTEIANIAANDMPKQKGNYKNEQVLTMMQRVSSHISSHIQSLLHHPSKSVLTLESNWLIKQLEGYDLSRHGEGVPQRSLWLRDHLPRILSGLLQESCCPQIDCPRRTTMPDKSELHTWSQFNSIAKARLYILAHFHGSTCSVVKARLHRRIPR